MGIKFTVEEAFSQQGDWVSCGWPDVLEIHGQFTMTLSIAYGNKLPGWPLLNFLAKKLQLS